MKMLGKNHTTKLHTRGAVCGNFLHQQCWTTSGMWSTLTEAVRVNPGSWFSNCIDIPRHTVSSVKSEFGSIMSFGFGS